MLILQINDKQIALKNDIFDFANLSRTELFGITLYPNNLLSIKQCQILYFLDECSIPILIMLF
jgi:hypothetical protein